MSDSTLWWLLAGAAVALELFTGTFYLLMLAVGMAAAALAAHAGAGTPASLWCRARWAIKAENRPSTSNASKGESCGCARLSAAPIRWTSGSLMGKWGTNSAPRAPPSVASASRSAQTAGGIQRLTTSAGAGHSHRIGNPAGLTQTWPSGVQPS